ncbi:hypothetical protein [Streptomyces sp. NPDC004546]
MFFAADSAALQTNAPAVFDAAGEDTKVWIAYRKGGVSDLTATP